MSFQLLLEENDGPADFETAIAATGLGKFNLFLLLIAVPSGWAVAFDSKTMSYVAPVAQCDLELSLEDKGLLNAITYIGILSSGFIWGVLADTYGRKNLIVLCYLLDTVFIFLSGISQNFIMLLVSKYLAGFVMNGPTAILISLLSEFHSSKHRARFFLIQGMFSNLANIILPIMAYFIFQRNMHFVVYGLELHSWNLYILLCAIPSLFSGFAHLTLPESPKFLMSVGKNEEALKVFRKVYSMNTGNPPEDYPIKCLVDETLGERADISNNNGHEIKKKQESDFKKKAKNVLSLFCPPHLWVLVFLSCLQLGYKMGLNSLKNWLPQLFTAMNDYSAVNGDNTNFCDVLDAMAHSHKNISSNCVVNYDNGGVYTNLMIVQSASLVSFLITGTIINIIGNRNLFIIFGTVSGLCGGAIYFARNTETVVALSTVLTAVSAVNTVIFNVAVVELLPTRLRTMAISLTRLVGLVQTITGNLIFPHLLKAGCAPSFLYVGLVTVVCSFMALFLPKEKSLN